MAWWCHLRLGFLLLTGTAKVVWKESRWWGAGLTKIVPTFAWSRSETDRSNSCISTFAWSRSEHDRSYQNIDRSFHVLNLFECSRFVLKQGAADPYGTARGEDPAKEVAQRAC